jgi:hypothetical protein
MTAVFIPACSVYYLFIIKKQTTPQPPASDRTAVILILFNAPQCNWGHSEVHLHQELFT